jgi:hypothetical protein
LFQDDFCEIYPSAETLGRGSIEDFRQRHSGVTHLCHAFHHASSAKILAIPVLLRFLPMNFPGRPQIEA